MRFEVLILCLSAAVSCELLPLPEPVRGPARSFTVSGGLRPDERVSFGADTAVLISAVRMPDGYDWRRDSLMGAVDCEVVLYENLKVKLSFPAGPSAEVSPDPDAHHIIDGRLYTEYSGPETTVIKCDGVEVVRFKGREYLKGLIVRGGSIYTLSVDRSSGAFSYRKDGALILRKESGSVIGGFDDWAYGQNGALYEDCGHIYFSYSGISGGKYFSDIVEDGQDLELRLASASCHLVDSRMVGGRHHYIYQSVDTFHYYDGAGYGKMAPGLDSWKDPRFVITCRGVEIAGEYTASKRQPVLCRFFENVHTGIGEPGYIPVIRDESVCTYRHNSDGTLSVTVGGAGASVPGEPVYLFTDCVAFTGDRLFLALTPRDVAGEPYLWMDGKKCFIHIYGYLTGISICS